MINSLPQRRALVLDFDGVIVDSEGTQLQAVNGVLARYGATLSAEDWAARCVGRKAAVFLPEILGPALEPRDLPVLLEEKSCAYRRLMRQQDLPARAGILHLIETAVARGFRCAIASATPEADIRYYTDRLGISGMFQAIVSSDAVAHPKPAPDVYLRAAEILRVEPARCVVVEDTPVGIAAALAAGMRCVAYPNRWTDHMDLSAADFAVAELDMIAELRILRLVEQVR